MSSPPAKRPWYALSPLSNQYPALHGLRVFGILSVVQHHVSDWFRAYRVFGRRPPAWSEASHAVWYGMDLFFVLSGFLIGTMLLHAEEKGGGSLGRFYARRALRILPPYYAVLCLLCFVVPGLLHLSLSAQQWRYLPYEFAYLTNYSPNLPGSVMPYAWSLAVEEHFYLAVPLLVLVLGRMRSPAHKLWALAGLWALGPVVRLVEYQLTQPWDNTRLVGWFYVRTHLRFDILVAGVFLAYAHKHYRDRLTELFARRAVRWSALAFSLACFALLSWPQPQHDHPRWNLFCWGTLTALAYVPFVLYLLHAKGPLERFLSSPAFLPLATLGYGVYLVHVPLLVIFIVPVMRALVFSGALSMGAAWWVALVLVMLLSFALSYLLHVLLERPVLALRDRLTGP